MSDVLVSEKIDGGLLMCEGAREKSQEVTKGSLFNLFKQNIARQNQYNNLSYIAMYWFITSLVFLYGFWEHSMLKGILFVFMSVIFIFGPIVAMILTVIKYPIPPKHIRCASWFIPAIMLIIILGWVAIELEHARTSKCQYITAFAIVGHILLFNFVLYREDVTKLTKSQSLSLMHNRYLKYFHSFVWLIVVALLGYSTWQLTKTPESISDFDTKAPRSCL